MAYAENDDNVDKLKNYILYPELSIHDPPLALFGRSLNEKRLLHLPKGPASTKLVPRRDFISGKIIEFIEVDLDDVGANANNSTSMRREPCLLEETVRGSAMNYPFWPGGFDEPVHELVNLHISDLNFIESEFTLIPPGFKNGFNYDNNVDQNEIKANTSTTLETTTTGDIKANTETATEASINDTDNDDNLNLLNDLEKNLDVQEWIKITKNEVKKSDNSKKNINKENALNFSSELKDIEDDLMKMNAKPILEISKVEKKTNMKSEWAEMIDISQPLTDFNEKIPCPAMKYPFELDVFQKQAILKLEERQYVFVAAHTSAGKTVVAEYAIALSQRDLTRTIYTSPIKALSNQKYRDFKETFKDVGLITGDMQIEPTATCLIMTTEILRSMLYCGSDITRDLEYVIFDEVHYINNPERGHVWEEIIILLPEHVQIIMLSATVPNTMELADWVGSTKKRKVYVISTLKRPVPLMHYLYTGVDGKTRNDIFLLVDENGRFIDENYKNAVECKKQIQCKGRYKSGEGSGGGGRGGGGGGGGSGGGGGFGNIDKKMTPQMEQCMWIALIDFLKRNNKMPVVAFTLSRNRCDFNINALKSVDLNTEHEKGLVHKFFQRCLMKLKPPDRRLPQVIMIKNALERGFGIHHSGILPILKEIVEMLFQFGLVKLLFATETFAMGVNMPARTVIFDSHVKYDGIEVRGLKPGEYIQMAGRAGRRGHDENGTVIMLCKNKMPPKMELRDMILGQPEKLQSQFILRYAVILTCLRIESIKVEDIMQYSFKEFKQKLEIPGHRKQLEVAEDKFSKLPPLGEHLKSLFDFYNIAFEYVTERSALMNLLFKQQKINKELKIGRVLMVTQGKHFNKLAILLSMKEVKCSIMTFKVLVLDHLGKATESQDYINRNDMFYKLLSLAPQNKFFQPEGIGGHTILDILASDIIQISKLNIKVDADIIIRNWEQRQLERFKDTAPGPTVVKTVSELCQLNKSYIENPNSIKFINMSKDILITEDDELALIGYTERLWEQVKKMLPYTNIPDFEQDLVVVYERKVLERKIEELKHKNSTKNLSLYPDYCNKLETLRALKYIDETNEVTLKGKVACEMGQNELLITELILCNIFNDLNPADIAALLSGLVFQSKIKDDQKIPKHLQACVNTFMEINDNILEKEKRNNVIIENVERLNFGLLEVVYEWARNKPFAEIMKLTNVQEGIIVRCIQQLDETLRDVKTAAIRIGNPTLQSKMEEASTAIKRDIVFTASLYTAL